MNKRIKKKITKRGGYKKYSSYRDNLLLDYVKYLREKYGYDEGCIFLIQHSNSKRVPESITVLYNCKPIMHNPEIGPKEMLFEWHNYIQSPEIDKMTQNLLTTIRGIGHE